MQILEKDNGPVKAKPLTGCAMHSTFVHYEIVGFSMNFCPKPRDVAENKSLLPPKLVCCQLTDPGGMGRFVGLGWSWTLNFARFGEKTRIGAKSDCTMLEMLRSSRKNIIWKAFFKMILLSVSYFTKFGRMARTPWPGRGLELGNTSSYYWTRLRIMCVVGRSAGVFSKFAFCDAIFSLLFDFNFLFAPIFLISRKSWAALDLCWPQE